MTKKNIDNKVNNKLHKEKIDINADIKVHRSGIGNNVLYESQPRYLVGPSEVSYDGENNSYIVLGRDRPSHLGSGYGGLGDTGAGSIDIVAGRDGKDGDYVNPNFLQDAARIHISQKTDVDTNFSLADGTNYSTSESAVGIKADAVRVAARRSVKIVAGCSSEAQNYGVDVIANNDDADLQPMVKGDNLADALDQLVKDTQDLVGIVQAYGKEQDIWNGVLATLVQHSPFYGSLTLPMQHHFEQGIECIFKHVERYDFSS